MLKKCSHAVTLAAILGASSGLLFGQATTTVSDTFVGPDGAPVQVRMKITPSSTFTSADGFVVPIFSSANIISNGAFSIKLVPNAGTVPAGSSYRVDYTLNGIPFHETWVVPQSQTSVKLGAVRTLIPPPLSTVSPLTSVGDMFTLGAGLALARVAANAASTLMFLSQSSSSIPTWVQPSFAHLAGTAGDTQLANAYSGVGTCGANQFATTLSRNAPPTCVRPDFSNLTGTATAVQVPNLSALNGSLTDAQLANPYSGAGACPANQFAATLSRNAGPTCAQPAFSSVAGTASASQVPSLSALNGVLNDAQLASPYSGIGSCAANQAVTGLSRNAGPTCTTLNSGYVDTSIAKTGVDLNSSSQVQSTHISGAASNTVPVFNGSGGLNNSSLSQDANGNLSSANSLYVRGLTPWADVHAYGSRGVMFAGGTPGTITTTGTIAAGSPNLSTAADLNWAVGDGIVVPGAGPAPSLSSPSYLGVAICTRVSTGSTPFYDNSASCSYSPAPQYRSVSYTWKVAVKDGAGGQAVPASITANGPPVIMEGLGRLDFVPVPGNGLTLYLGTLGFGVQYAYCSKNPAWVNYGQQASITLTASATNYVYLDASQNNCPITASTTGYPANNLYYAIARVITGTAAIGNIMDDRVEVWPVIFAAAVNGAEAYEVYRGNVGIAETWGLAGASGWIPFWSSGSYTQGQVVSPNPQNGHYYIDTTPGTNSTAASAPAWCTGKDCTISDGGITWQEFGQDGMAFGDIGATGTICDTCNVNGNNDWLLTTVQAVNGPTSLVLAASATNAVTSQNGVRHDDTAAFNACLATAAQSAGSLGGSIMAQSGTCYMRGNFWVSGLTFPATTPNNSVGVRLLLDGVLRTSRRIQLPYSGTVIEGIGGYARPSFAKPPVATIVGGATPLIHDVMGTTHLKNLFLQCGNECILEQGNFLTMERVADLDAFSNSDPLPLIEFYGVYGHTIKSSTMFSTGQTDVPALYFTRRLSDANGSGITRITDSYLVSGNIFLEPAGASSNMGEIYVDGLITENLLAPVVQCDILAGTICQGITLNNTSVNDSAASALATVGGGVMVGTIGTGTGYIGGVTITNGGANQLLDCSAQGSIKNANVQAGGNTGTLTATSLCGPSFVSAQNQHTADSLDIGTDFNSPQFSIAPAPLGCTYSAPTATCISKQPMTLKTGDTVYISGVADNGYNGLATNVTMVGTAPYYQVQFTPAGTPAGASGGGAIQARNLKQFVMGTGASGNQLQILASNLLTKLWSLDENGKMTVTDPLSSNLFSFQGAPLTASRTYTLPDASGTLPVASGAITAGNCAKWASTSQLADAGVCGSASINIWANPPNSAGTTVANTAQNAINISPMYIPFAVTFGHIGFDVAIADTSNNSDVGIYDVNGNLRCDIGAQTLSTGVKNISCTQGTVTISAGIYFFAFTTAAATPTLKLWFNSLGSGNFTWWSQTSSTTSSGGALPATINVSLSGGPTLTTVIPSPFVILH